MNNYLIAILIIIVMITILLIASIPDYLLTETVPKIQLATIKLTNGKIPPIIHRTWYSNTMSKLMYNVAYQSWVNLNPSYTMFWYDDIDVEAYMKQYGNREYRAFKKLICNAYKMDLFRLLKLYEIGGVYADSYTVPNISIDEMIARSGLDEKDIFISILDCEMIATDAIHNGFIITSPKHPFIKQAIQDVLGNIERGKEDVAMSMTGPRALSKSIHRCLGHQIPHQVGLNNHQYQYYLFKFPFGFYQNIYDKNKIVLRKKMDLLYCFWYQKVWGCLKRDKTNYVYASAIGKVCYTDNEVKKLFNL